jgi:hypothetical protein
MEPCAVWRAAHHTDQEYLIRHPDPGAGFTPIGYDSLLRADVMVRPRVLPTGLLATFPVFGVMPVIVIGESELTARRSTAWVLTVLHEHFHQWQMSAPQYQERVAALNLMRGDSTGMWMLNFPFPYASPLVSTRFETFARHLVTVGASTTSAHASMSVRSIELARRQLRSVLSPADYRYMAFQMWQEGVARYTELQLARMASRRFEVGASLAALPDFTSYAAEADSLFAEIQSAGARPLRNGQRVEFYPAGAAQALVLDAVRPDWKLGYLAGPLSLDAPAIPQRRIGSRTTSPQNR